MNRRKRFKKKELMVLILILSLLLLSSNNFLNSTNNMQASKQEMNLSSFSYIYINDDSDFVDYGFLGNGTIDVPYLIQDMILSDDSPTESSIKIEDTTKYFIISNNTITAINSNGIYIDNVASGTGNISNNTINFLGEFYIGIRIIACDGLRIENNSIEYCGKAIDLWWCEEIEIYNNEIKHCTVGLIGTGVDFVKFEYNLMYSIDHAIGFYFGSSYITIKENNLIRVTSGISFLKTAYSEISSNYIQSQNECGISFSESTNNFVHNNTIENASIGIEIRTGSDHNIISENKLLTSFQNSLFVESSDYITCTKNNFSESSYDGIFVNYASKILFQNNDILASGLNGIYLRKSFEIYIGKNFIANSEKNGIYSTNSSKVVITFNYFFYNFEYGVFLDYQSYFNVIHHNEFVNNNQDGISQAFDDGEQNTWYDSNLEEGNFWTDFSGKNGYEIDGSANSVDIYAFKSDNGTTNDVTFLNNTLWISILLLVFFIKRKNRYK